MARCDIALVTINLPLKNKLVAFLCSLEAMPLSLLGLKKQYGVSKKATREQGARLAELIVLC